MTPEDRKFNFERYDKVIESNSKGLDRLIEIIGTGTFALSLALVTGLGPSDIKVPLLLVVSWACFGMAILLQALAYVFAINFHATCQRVLMETPSGVNSTSKKRADDFKKLNSVLRTIVLILISIGMALLIVFASLNLYAQQETEAGINYIEEVGSLHKG